MSSGGAAIGLATGLSTSLLTKYTRQVRVVEPLAVFSLAYLAFLTAELFHWSGIISIIAYGITVKRYAFQNLSKKSYTTVKYGLKTMASVSDCVIFIFLGMELIQRDHYWHPGFLLATIILCLIFRFVSVFLLGHLVNLGRMDKIELKEQFIMAFGGLRGAVGFSLAEVLCEDVWYRDLFTTTALAMVIFTVFLQGGTIKIFVKLFDIRLQSSKKQDVSDLVQRKFTFTTMDGIVIIAGDQRKRTALKRIFRSFDESLKGCLINKDSQNVIERKLEKIILTEHMTNLYAPKKIPQTLSNDTKTVTEKTKISSITLKALKVDSCSKDLLEERKHIEHHLYRKYRSMSLSSTRGVRGHHI